MQRMIAVVATVGFPTGFAVGAAEDPAGGAAFESRVGDPVGAGDQHLDLVQQRFTLAEKHHLQPVGGTRPEIQHTGGLDERPRRFASLIAISPVGSRTVVAVGIDQFQAAAPAGRPGSPMSTTDVSHFLHHDVKSIRGHDQRRGIGGKDRLRGRQGQVFAAVGQLTVEIPDQIGAGQTGVVGQQMRGILRHHQVAVGRQGRVHRKREADAVDETPAADVHRVEAAIMEFDVLILAGAGDRVVHDFVDDDVLKNRRGVGRAGGAPTQAPKVRGAIGVSPKGHALALPTESQGVEHPRLVRVHQVKGLAIGLQSEAKLAFLESDKSAGGKPRPVRNAELIRRRVIAQPAA